MNGRSAGRTDAAGPTPGPTCGATEGRTTWGRAFPGLLGNGLRSGRSRGRKEDTAGADRGVRPSPRERIGGRAGTAQTVGIPGTPDGWRIS